jgi:hypothetical protein
LLRRMVHSSEHINIKGKDTGTGQSRRQKGKDPGTGESPRVRPDA